MILLLVASKTFHSAIIVTCTLCTIIVLQTINSLLMVSGHKKKFTHHKIKIKNKVCKVYGEEKTARSSRMKFRLS